MFIKIQLMSLKISSLRGMHINCYICSLNTWASRDSPLAQLVKELDLYLLCNPKVMGSTSSRSNHELNWNWCCSLESALARD